MILGKDWYSTTKVFVDGGKWIGFVKVLGS